MRITYVQVYNVWLARNQVIYFEYFGKIISKIKFKLIFSCSVLCDCEIGFVIIAVTFKCEKLIWWKFVVYTHALNDKIAQTSEAIFSASVGLVRAR